MLSWFWSMRVGEDLFLGVGDCLFSPQIFIWLLLIFTQSSPVFEICEKWNFSNMERALDFLIFFPNISERSFHNFVPTCLIWSGWRLQSSAIWGYFLPFKVPFNTSFCREVKCSLVLVNIKLSANSTYVLMSIATGRLVV